MARGDRFLVWLFALKFLLSPCVLANQCPPDWERVGKACYRQIETKETWDDAAVKCRDLGGGLAVPDSMAEQEDIWKTVKSWEVESSHSDDFWIGCRGGEDRDWDCVEHDGTEGNFNHWNGSSHEKMSNEKCAVVKGREGRWFAEKCKKKYNYAICETSQSQNVEVPTYCAITDDNGHILSHCLTGHSFRDLPTKGVIACSSACRQEPRCRSFNVVIRGDKKVCYLNDKRRHEVGQEDFASKENCFYFEGN